MRLQLARAAVLACSIALAFADAGPAFADQRASSWLSVYTDDDGLTVISPQLGVRADVGEELELEVGYDVDVISAASVDVVSQASPRGYTEERHGFLAGATYSPRADRRFGARYVPSFEPDYHSHGVALFGEREWLDRRLTTRVDARITRDRVGRTGDDAEHWGTATSEVGGVSLGWIASRWTVLQLAYEVQYRHGFLGNPYRYVGVDWPGGSVMVSEVVPGRRTRHALAIGARHALSRAWFLSARYRLYGDDWGLVSHTGEYELQRAFGRDRAIVGVNARFYTQGAADFYRQDYAATVGSLPALRSADKSLASSSSVLVGVRGEARVLESDTVGQVRVVGKVELYQQVFDDVLRIAERRAVIVSLGLSTEL